MLAGLAEPASLKVQNQDVLSNAAGHYITKQIKTYVDAVEVTNSEVKNKTKKKKVLNIDKSGILLVFRSQNRDIRRLN